MEKRGVYLEIITARKRDQPIYQSFRNADLFKELMDKGAVVYEEPYKYLHMKALDIDDGKHFSLGSLNQDHSSYYMNNEANMFFSQSNTTKPSACYKQFSQIYQNLKMESRLVGSHETYETYSGYFESKFWKLSLYLSRIICMNRIIKGMKQKRIEDQTK